MLVHFISTISFQLPVSHPKFIMRVFLVLSAALTLASQVSCGVHSQLTPPVPSLQYGVGYGSDHPTGISSGASGDYFSSSGLDLAHGQSSRPSVSPLYTSVSNSGWSGHAANQGLVSNGWNNAASSSLEGFSSGSNGISGGSFTFGGVSGGAFNSGNGNTANGGTTYSQRTETVRIPVPQPYPVPVNRPVAVPVAVARPVEVPRPVRVEVPHPVKVVVARPYPVLVPRPYPVTLKVKEYVKVPTPVHVHVPRPYPVVVEKPYPVRVPTRVEVNVPVPVNVQSQSDFSHSAGYGGVISGLGVGHSLGFGSGSSNGYFGGHGGNLNAPTGSGYASGHGYSESSGFGSSHGAQESLYESNGGYRY